MLFRNMDFLSSAGLELQWKVVCDDFDDKDWQWCASRVAETFYFKEVHGVPTGGNKFAEALLPYCNYEARFTLVVDDVLTTGKSMENTMATLEKTDPYIALQCIAVFSRNCNLSSRVGAIWKWGL